MQQIFSWHVHVIYFHSVFVCVLFCLSPCHLLAHSLDVRVSVCLLWVSKTREKKTTSPAHHGFVVQLTPVSSFTACAMLIAFSHNVSLHVFYYFIYTKLPVYKRNSCFSFILSFHFDCFLLVFRLNTLNINNQQTTHIYLKCEYLTFVN